MMKKMWRRTRMPARVKRGRAQAKMPPPPEPKARPNARRKPPSSPGGRYWRSCHPMCQCCASEQAAALRQHEREHRLGVADVTPIDHAECFVDGDGRNGDALVVLKVLADRGQVAGDECEHLLIGQSRCRIKPAQRDQGCGLVAGFLDQL